MKKQTGITLIALVITIIVLLILAGVSISMVIGQNGVLTQADTATAETRKATAKEEVELAWASVDSDYWNDWTNNSSVKKDDYYKDEARLQAYLEGKGIVDLVTENDDGTYTVIYTSSEDKMQYTMIIDENGNAKVETSLHSSSIVYTSLGNYKHEASNGIIAAHDTSEGICSKCGEMVLSPGLWDESGNKLKTWQELLDEGSIVVEDGVLRGGWYGNGSYGYRYEYRGESTGILVVDSSVKEIRTDGFGGYAYTNASPNLTGIVLPNSVTKLGDECFSGCANLKLVELSEGLTIIGEQAFRKCINIASITIPKSVTKIDSYAFEYCETMQSITWVHPIDDIGVGFIDGTAITSVTIPKGTTIAQGFAYTSKLKTITIPSSVTSIGRSAFLKSGIAEIYYDGTIEQWNNIDKYQDYRASYWNNGCGKITVYCTDGTTTVAACSYYSGFF